jgi:hypothetical protein
MEGIAQRGHALMQWLAVLGLLGAWATFDRSPRVVEEARYLVDGALRRPEQLGIDADQVLQDLHPGAAALLSQYRFEHLRLDADLDGSWRIDKEKALQPMLVDDVLALGQRVIKQVDQQGGKRGESDLTELLLVGPLRQRVARLKTWQEKSGLGPSAALEEVELALRSSVQIPGTDQKIPLDQCMLFVALGIAALQLMLTSLLATLRGLAPRREEQDLSWVMLQRGVLGLVLTYSCLVGPPLAWFAQDFLRSAEFNQLPKLGSLLLGGLLLATTAAVLRQARLVRRELLTRAPREASNMRQENAPICATQPATDAATIATPRTQPRKAA